MYLRGNSIGMDDGTTDSFYDDKPRGALPRRDYVWYLLLYEYDLVLYFMVRNDTLKKGGNAPRATDEKRFLSSASLILGT